MYLYVFLHCVSLYLSQSLLVIFALSYMFIVVYGDLKYMVASNYINYTMNVSLL